MSIVTVLGAGVMGSAICLPASDRGHQVRLAGTHLDNHIIASLKATGRHPKLAAALPAGVTAYTDADLAEALAGSDVAVLGVSSAGVGWAIDRLAATLEGPIPLLMVTKGLHPERDTLTVLPDLVAREISRRRGFAIPVAAIGGPCIAGELAVRRHTGTVITSHDAKLARRLCAMLETDYYHPRPSADVIGVEVCAAFKNFFAIAVGWAAGQREKLATAENGAFNYNAAALIFAQAIAELIELTRALGGTVDSAWGLPGAGDLYVTCLAGRNSRLGNHLGQGLTYRETREGPMKGETIEGAELGVIAADALDAMMVSGRLDPASVPLTRALLAALTRDQPLTLPWQSFHRGG